ncbi:17709_t:CDS:2, partial [Gigaspora margarita]
MATTKILIYFEIILRITSSILQSKLEKKTTLGRIGTVCSVMNSTIAVLQSAIGRVDTTLIKHIEDSPIAANSELEYDYRETDTNRPYNIDKEMKFNVLQ